MLTEQYNIPLELHDYLAFVLVSAMFQDVLNDVIAILVLHKSLDVIVQFLEYRGGLFLVAMFQDTLDHPATIGMG